MDTNENNVEKELPAADPVAGADSCNRLAAARQFAVEQYNRLRRAAGAKLDEVYEYTRSARRQINAGWDVTCARARDLHRSGEEYVRANPTKSILTALGVGLLIGLLAGRSSR